MDQLKDHYPDYELVTSNVEDYYKMPIYYVNIPGEHDHNSNSFIGEIKDTKTFISI